MIKKINRIQKLAIFDDFKWSEVPNLNEFCKKNIIYGWNYSGKTTISRIFGFLRDKQLSMLYKDAQFEVQLDNSSKIISSDIAAFPYIVKVFNTDYIESKLRFKDCDGISPISFDVGENVKLRQEIERIQRNIEKIEGTTEIKSRRERYQEKIDEFNAFETKFTDEARRIKNDVFNSAIEFQKSHLKKIISELGGDSDGAILTENEARKLKDIAISTNDKSQLTEIRFSPSLNDLYAKLSDLLSESPSEAEVIEILESDNKKYEWAKQGLDYHQAGGVCAFCGNKIQNERFVRLNNYFSNAAASLRDRLDGCKGLIANERAAVSAINIPKSKNDFCSKFADSYVHLLRKIDMSRESYEVQLKKLEGEISRKVENNIHNKLTIAKLDPGIVGDFKIAIEEFNLAIIAHNNFVGNFQKEQEDAREKLRIHCVASYLAKEKYFEKLKAKMFSDRCVSRYNCYISNAQKKILEHESNIKSVVAGQKKINGYIKAFLGREDVRISVDQNDMFQLKRAESFALNLSEGEKTAVAFSYFLVDLESLHNDGKLREAIIFIDDPISSLDSNHIAQVYSLINSFFFRKGLCNENPEKITECFRQIFISTHNFDFFSFLCDSAHIRKRRDKNDSSTGCSFYMVKRSGTGSLLKRLPKKIQEYKSEYIYLFEIIYRYYKEGCPEEHDDLILLPNAIRRFLEIYTLMKLPHETSSFEGRLNELMGGAHSLKILNHFSHFTSFDKLTKHDNLLFNLRAACEELFELLKKDTQHLMSLKRAIDANKK